MAEKKNALDSLFDYAERVVDGVSPYLKEDEEGNVVDAEYVEVKSRQQTLLKDDPLERSKRKGPREVTLKLKAISKRKSGGVGLLMETTTHEIVVVNLSDEDWETLCDNADWMRMVP